MPYINIRCVDKCFLLETVTDETFSYSRLSDARAGFADLHLTFYVEYLAFENLIREVKPPSQDQTYEERY
jgi:hypothetical protein